MMKRATFDGKLTLVLVGLTINLVEDFTEFDTIRV
jgi:hypothetical protein